MAHKKHLTDVAQLANDLEIITLKYRNERILGNTFLKLGKPTTENLRLYRQHNDRFKLVKFTLVFITFFPILFAHGLREIARSVYFRTETNDQINQEKSSDFLFVSHYTYSPSEPSYDNYFGILPNYLNSLGKKSAIFLINHTKKSASAINGELKIKSQSVQPIIPKAIPMRNLLKEFRSQLPSSLKMFLGSIIDQELNLRQRLLLIDASINQFSRSTFAAISIVVNLERILERLQPKIVVLTFEGHSFEALALNMVHNKFPNTRACLFQHAPIVKSQFGLIGTLRSLNPSDLVLTTGSAIQNYFNRKIGHLDGQITILGSPKAKGVIGVGLSDIPKQERDLVCLFAPEASADAFREMKALALECSLAMWDRSFILRSHPAFPISPKMKKAMLREFPSNLVLSTDELEHDLKSSGFCVYRGTAVAIQGLIHGVQPIHFSSNLDDGLDPLAITELMHESFSDSTSLITYLKSINVSANVDLSLIQTKMIQTYTEYFQELDPSILTKILPI